MRKLRIIIKVSKTYYAYVLSICLIDWYQRYQQLLMWNGDSNVFIVWLFNICLYNDYNVVRYRAQF